MTDVQGPGPVDVLGDMIIVFDPDLQVLWTWDTFDHLDTARLATAGETCTRAGGGCPPFYLADKANDWTHGNAIQLTADGNLRLFGPASRLAHQDQLRQWSRGWGYHLEARPGRRF